MLSQKGTQDLAALQCKYLTPGLVQYTVHTLYISFCIYVTMYILLLLLAFHLAPMQDSSPILLYYCRKYNCAMTIKSSTQTVAIILKKKLKLFTTAVNKSGSCAIIIVIYSIILFYSFTFDCTFYLTKHAEQLCNAT